MAWDSFGTKLHWNFKIHGLFTWVDGLRHGCHLSDWWSADSCGFCLLDVNCSLFVIDVKHPFADTSPPKSPSLGYDTSTDSPPYQWFWPKYTSQWHSSIRKLSILGLANAHNDLILALDDWGGSEKKFENKATCQPQSAYLVFCYRVSQGILVTCVMGSSLSKKWASRIYG